MCIWSLHIHPSIFCTFFIHIDLPRYNICFEADIFLHNLHSVKHKKRPQKDGAPKMKEPFLFLYFTVYDEYVCYSPRP